MRSAIPPMLAVASTRTWLAPGPLGLDIFRITGELCSGQPTPSLPFATPPTLAQVESRNGPATNDGLHVARSATPRVREEVLSVAGRVRSPVNARGNRAQ